MLGQLVATRPPGLLLVFTARSPGGLAPLLAEGPVERIELAPLEDEDAEAMIDAVAAALPLDLREREQVLRQGEGVPFYLEELARAAQQAVDRAALPITLTGQLQARLAAPGIDRDVVGVLAVAGQELDERPRLGPAHRDRRPPSPARPPAGRRPGGGHRRNRVGLPVPARPDRRGRLRVAAPGAAYRLHRRIAEVLAGLDGTGRAVDWNVVGHHLRLAQRPLDAYEAILAGADEARRSGAIPEALQSYREALDLVAELPDPGVRDCWRSAAGSSGASPPSPPAGSRPRRRSRTSRAAPSSAASSGPGRSTCPP